MSVIWFNNEMTKFGSENVLYWCTYTVVAFSNHIYDMLFTDYRLLLCIQWIQK